jgi:hypothetical protein
MSGYTQLAREQRYQIHVLVQTGQNQTQMATSAAYIKPRSVENSGRTVGCVAIGLTKPIAYPKRCRNPSGVLGWLRPPGNRWRPWGERRGVPNKSMSGYSANTVMIFPQATGHRVKDSIMIRSEGNNETSTQASQSRIQARSRRLSGGAWL